MNIYKKSDIPDHLQKYFEPAEIGLEQTPEQYVTAMVEVFRCVRDVLADDGTLWLNIGDTYARTGGTDRKVSASAKVGSTRNTMEQMIDRTSKASALGLKHKDLIGIPWMLAFALRADGWFLRQDIIWAKPNPMPESVTDRCTKSHEYIFLLSKSERYFYDHEAVKEKAVADHGPGNKTHKGATEYERGEGEFHRTKTGLVGYAERQRAGKGGKNAVRGQGHQRDSDTGPANREGRDMQDIGASETRNKRSVWTVATVPYKGAHFATFPPALIEPCILAGSRPGDVVLDPFFGSGTTGMVAQNLGRRWLGCELNPAYGPLQDERLAQQGFEFA